MSNLKLFIVFIFLTNYSFSQLIQKKDSLLNEYDNHIPISSMPYNNGLIHYNFDSPLNKENHRYFEFNEFTSGNLIYNGQTYNNVNLKYDLLQQKLVVKIENISVEMNDENINGFTINKNYFERFLFKKESNLKSGFYKLIKTSLNTSLLINYQKEKKEVIAENQLKHEYYLYSFYVLKKDNNYFNFNNQNDIISLFPKKKKEIKSFFKSNSDMLKTNKSTFLINLIQKIHLTI